MVKVVHDEIIKIQGGARGIISEGRLESCLKRPFTYIYGRRIYPTLFLKAAALLQCIAGPMHPFADGNKRTALAATGLFLSINGYSFIFPNDAKDFMVSIASGKIRGIRRISKWIGRTTVKTILYNIPEDERYSAFSDLVFTTGGRRILFRPMKI